MSALTAVLLAGALASKFATPTPPSTPDVVLGLEYRFAETLLRRDGVAHGNLLAEDLVHIGFEGQIAGKAEYMRFFEGGNWKYTRYVPSGVAIKVLGGAAVVTGRVDRAIVVNGKETVGAFAFTLVWARVADGWKMTSSSHVAVAR